MVGISGVARWNTSLYLVPAANIMEELQIEFFVPLEEAKEALRACWGVAKDWGAVVPVSQVHQQYPLQLQLNHDDV